MHLEIKTEMKAIAKFHFRALQHVENKPYISFLTNWMQFPLHWLIYDSSSASDLLNQINT